jgi:hypothetical protein
MWTSPLIDDSPGYGARKADSLNCYGEFSHFVSV